MKFVIDLEQSTPAPSAIGRLLEELSWGGSRGVQSLRGGGRHLENVLTTEVLQALDFLPRSTFLAQVFHAAQGADAARGEHATAAEDATITVLPGPTACGALDPACRTGIEIQPDAIITSPTTYALIEAKRNGSGTFPPQQLAREFAHTLLVAPPRSPLLLLILHRPPPVRLHRFGTLSITDAINIGISEVLNVLHAEGHTLTSEEVLDHVPTCLAWITWSTLRDTVSAAADAFDHDDASITTSIRRMAGGAVRAIDWHRR